MPAGNPEAYAQMPPQDMMPSDMGGQGGMDIQTLIALATQILGHPPQDEQELMMALEMLQQMQSGGGAMASPMEAGRAMAPGNAALMQAVGGGPQGY